MHPMRIKKYFSFPTGTEKYKFPFGAKIRDNSLHAFLVPSGSSLSPYLPSPICSLLHGGKIEIMLHSLQRAYLKYLLILTVKFFKSVLNCLTSMNVIFAIVLNNPTHLISEPTSI